MTAAILAVLLLGLFISGMLIYSTMSWGWVCLKFWGWFVLPLFVDTNIHLPDITFLQACGLMFFIGLFKNQIGTSIKKEYKDENATTLSILISPWLTLLVAWLFMIFFM